MQIRNLDIIAKYEKCAEKHVTINLTESIRTNFSKLSKSLKTIFSYSKLFVIEDDNDQRRVTYVWEPFQETNVYKGYPKVTQKGNNFSKNFYEATRYDKATEIYAFIAARIASQHNNKPIEVYKRTYEFYSRVTRGCHESYHSSLDWNKLSPFLLPFLAIRPIFGGSSGYVKWLENEIRYLLSPSFFRGDFQP